MNRKGCLLLLILLFGLAPMAVPASDFTIGYLQLKKDPRYGKKRLYASYLTHPLGRPYRAAKVALGEIKFHAAKLGLEFKLKRVKAADQAQLREAVDEFIAHGTQFILLDLPAAELAELAQSVRDQPVVLFNLTAREDELRQAQCQPNLLHVIPNYAMLADALTQYLVSRKWGRVLVLQGARPEDAQIVAAFERSAKRYKASVVEVRPFVLSNDPRERDQNNVALLTGNADYDVVFVADADGEFARDVPYHTLKPTPVVGSEGLAAAAWHWAWERYGAPQLENRFEDAADRPMRSFDWAAWMAVKTIAESIQRSESADFDTLNAYLRNQEAVFDGFKGSALTFRAWDNQLRQPILLITHNWVVERAPITGFLHQTNEMDTLGYDERESECQF